MTAQRNPFEYAGANDLPPEMVLEYYIEDFNYSRFIDSKRNILLVGERGCGKSMTLLYNSWPLRRLKAALGKTSPPLTHIGIYIPCKTPLIQKDEYQLLDDFHASILSEHNFALSILYAIADTLAQGEEVLEGADLSSLRSRLEFILGAELPDGQPFFVGLMDFAQRVNLKTQQAVNDPHTPAIEYDATYSFASLILPLLGVLRSIPKLRRTHFMLLIDDAHDLNPYQLESLSSWIAYRDHSLFSFKVAIANIAKRKLRTTSGGSILEGHDYLRLDMVQPYQNEVSDFGRLANSLIQKRLTRFSIISSPEQFFPVSDQLERELAEAEASVRKEAEERYGGDARRVTDYIYKYKRAQYFRTRSPRANRPEYSGFSTLVFLSTGVIRNLLIPCYAMYDKVLSLSSVGAQPPARVQHIPPSVQSDVIIEQSRKLWDWLRDGIDQNIVGCSREDARRCYQLLDQLAILFRERLLKHRSEPRGNSFTVSGQTEEIMSKLEPLFEILREAQLLYVRSGPAKDKGKREWYYVPNRLLWPERGLDPHGQHARVSLQAAELWAAADKNKPLTFSPDEVTEKWELFDGAQ
jgi:hypothetical protein